MEYGRSREEEIEHIRRLQDNGAIREQIWPAIECHPDIKRFEEQGGLVYSAGIEPLLFHLECYDRELKERVCGTVSYLPVNTFFTRLTVMARRACQKNNGSTNSYDDDVYLKLLDKSEEVADIAWIERDVLGWTDNQIETSAWKKIGGGVCARGCGEEAVVVLFIVGMGLKSDVLLEVNPVRGFSKTYRDTTAWYTEVQRKEKAVMADTTTKEGA